MNELFCCVISIMCSVKPNTADYRSRPTLMKGLGIHENIHLSDISISETAWSYIRYLPILLVIYPRAWVNLVSIFTHGSISIYRTCIITETLILSRKWIIQTEFIVLYALYIYTYKLCMLFVLSATTPSVRIVWILIGVT